jgi:hypothetical protein
MTRIAAVEIPTSRKGREKWGTRSLVVSANNGFLTGLSARFGMTKGWDGLLYAALTRRSSMVVLALRHGLSRALIRIVVSCGLEPCLQSWRGCGPIHLGRLDGRERPSPHEFGRERQSIGAIERGASGVRLAFVVVAGRLSPRKYLFFDPSF